MRHFLLLALLLCAQAVFAQKKYTTIESTSEKARKAYNEGKGYSDKGEYAIALGYYEQALKADSNFVDARLKIAYTYLQNPLRDFFKAERFFEDVLAIAPTYSSFVYYDVAGVEMTLDKYEEAVQHLEAYGKLNTNDPVLRASAEKLLARARFAADAVKHPVPFHPKSVGSGVNSAMSEYFPSLTADGQTLVFTRDERGDENFFSSTLKDSVWQKAEPLDGVNTVMNEGAQAISPDGTWLVFTACNRSDDGSQGSCDLYWSQLKKGAWTVPVPFSSSINSRDWESQPTISADGKTIIFSKGPSGGRGNNDLYSTTRQPGGKWTKPEKLNGPVNTNGKEGTPFLHPDGVTLYFASDSLPGMGGVDLFFTRRQPDGSWSTPQNLGYPINTKADEATLIVSLDGKTGYYATARGKGTGLDIYSFEMPEYARPQAVTYAKAKVVDAVSGKPLVAKVDFTDLKTGQSFLSVNTKSDGTFLACLPAGKDYALAVTKEKYLFFSENFNLEETATFTKPYELEIALQPVPDSGATAPPAAKPIALRNVFFETASAELRPESSAELDRLADLLKQFPSLRIQLNGHTDNVGQPAYNLSLSENRAKAVYDYLIKKGIDARRLKFKGFGESKPVDTNDTEEGRARNRRTEFILW